MPDQTTAVPLPEPAGVIWLYGDHYEPSKGQRADAYTADQLRAYAQQCVMVERERCLNEIECGIWVDMTTAEILDSIAAVIRKGD